MKLTFQDYGIIMPFDENKVNVLTVESAASFTNILQMLITQIKGEEGKIFLSEENTIFSMPNQVELLWNPFFIEVNERKILTRLYQEMKKVSTDNCIEKLYDVKLALGNYLNSVCQHLPYNISFDVDLEESTIFKLCNTQIDIEEFDTMQRLIEYVKLISLLCPPKLVVLVNLKSYLTTEQLKELYQTFFCCKIYLLLIESTQRVHLSDEFHYILDKSDCLINLQE